MISKGSNSFQNAGIAASLANDTASVNVEKLFAGGGELGALMRAKDWSQTPLGPVESWPQNLRTCVRIVLTSRQPMFVWWGDELINLYNDAYRSIVGGKHPTRARSASPNCVARNLGRNRAQGCDRHAY